MFNDLKKENRYLIACSGGPDSMALLDMAHKYFDYIEAAHVNYHKRDSALRDEKIVRKYCKNNNIKFHLLNSDPKKVDGNFQAYAREQRYKFFGDICTKNNLDGVLVAHHMDDLIETYFMQMDKKLTVNYYGLASNIYLYYVFVHRPLLGYTKNDLYEYCVNNNIEFGIDESNLEDHYTRNKVRHSIVEKMSLKEKKKLVKEINKKNAKNLNDVAQIAKKIDAKKDYTVKQFLRIKNFKLGLRVLFGNKSDRFFEEMLRQIKDSDKYLYKGESFWLSKEYNCVHIFLKPTSYEYKIDKMSDFKKISNLYFRISKNGNSMEGVTISSKDFPITIRNCISGDKINMLYGTKKLNRYFIDNKVLIKDRLTWPVMLDNKSNAILVPGIGCDKGHYSKKHNIYMIKL